MAAKPPDEHPSGEAEPDESPPGKAASRDGSLDAADLAARLEAVQRRTEELAARVAGFRQETERLASGPAERDDASAGDGAAAADTAPGGEAAPHPDTPADEKAAGVEQHASRDAATPQRERRHRPRPSPNAPLVYDDEPGTSDEPTAEAGGGGADDARPEAAKEAKPKEANEDKPEDAKPEEAKADKPEEAKADKPKQVTGTKATEDGPPPAEKKRRSRTILGWLRRLRRLLIVLVVLAAVVFALRTWVAVPYTVDTTTMEPTLKTGDHLLVQKVSYHFHDPQRGDLVVFDRPSNWRVSSGTLVGRVIGVAGDRIVIRDNRVHVNGALLEETYLNKACHGTTAERRGHVIRVPKGALFVMGDNRCRSRDSRDFGSIPTGDVIGKAFLIFWPVSRFGSA